MLWAARSGLEPKPFPKVIQDAMDEGTALESSILEQLYTDHGFSFDYGGQQFQVELILGAWNGKTLIVRGKMDEKAFGRPVDVKALSQSTIDSFQSSALLKHYEWQQSVYCLGMGADMYYMPIYNKDTERIEPWSVAPRTPRYSREEIRDRVMQVEEWHEKGTMPDECPAEWGCQYYYLHDYQEREELPVAVHQMLRARIALARKVEAFTKARKTLDDAIKAQIGDGSYTFEGYSVSVVPNARKFNTEAAKGLLTAAEVDWQNDPDFWIPGQGNYLRVTKPKGKANESE